MEFVGIDWATRRAAWCAVDAAGRRLDEGVVPADEHGLTRLVASRGADVTAAVEMMSGAAWIAETLRGAGWDCPGRRCPAGTGVGAVGGQDRQDRCASARRARPPRAGAGEVLGASLSDRADLELLLRRSMHLIRLRTSAKNRIFGLLTQWGVRSSVAHLRQPNAIEALAERGVPPSWRNSIAEAVAVIELLDGRIAPIDEQLLEVARADDRARLLRTIPGVGWLLGLTFAVEIGDMARFPSAKAGRLLGHGSAGPPIRRAVTQGGLLAGRVAAVALGRGRSRPACLPPAEPWHRLYVDVRARHGNGNAAKSAVARKVLIAVWHACGRASNRSSPPPARLQVSGKLRPAPGRLTARLRIEKPGQGSDTGQCCAARVARKRIEHQLGFSRPRSRPLAQSLTTTKHSKRGWE